MENILAEIDFHYIANLYKQPSNTKNVLTELHLGEVDNFFECF